MTGFTRTPLGGPRRRGSTPREGLRPAVGHRPNDRPRWRRTATQHKNMGHDPYDPTAEFSTDDGARLTESGIDLSDSHLDLYGDYLDSDDGQPLVDTIEKVAETDDLVVLRDNSGHELNEWSDALGISRSALSERMHNLARKHYDGSGTGDPWSVSDPLVLAK